jgi:hypothetical protein
MLSRLSNVEVVKTILSTTASVSIGGWNAPTVAIALLKTTLREDCKHSFKAAKSARSDLVHSAAGAIHSYRPIPSPPTATASFAASTDGLNEGFPSKGIAELVCQIANPNTHPSARMSCFNSLAKGKKQVSFPNRDSDLPRKSPLNNDTAALTSTGGIMHLRFTTTFLFAP